MPQELIDEAMKRVLAKIQAEMPNVRHTSLSSNPKLPSNVAARTDPLGGSIEYNPFMLQTMSPAERENTVAHEMTHVRQQQETPFWSQLYNQIMPQGPYNTRSNEMEAFQTERDRSLRNHFSLPDPQSGATDIELPSPRRKNGTQRAY
jgi:hypothetical protein